MAKTNSAVRRSFLAEMNGLEFKNAKDFRDQLEKLAKAASLNVFRGRVITIGDNGGKNFFVSFVADQGGGCSGDWEPWAYALARDALLYDKKLWMVGTGPLPCGHSMVYAAIDYQQA